MTFSERNIIWCSNLCLLICQLTAISLMTSGQDVTGKFIEHSCFGNVVSLSCPRGNKVKVISDVFGYNARYDVTLNQRDCTYDGEGCVVVNRPPASVIHRYCEGKTSCNRFQVDRRQCNQNMTNYERIEYDCVPDSDIADICKAKTFTSKSGYIATPNFPNAYPADMDCRCRLSTLSAKTRVKLHSAYFSVKYDKPCKDWLEIETNGQKTKTCGAFKSTLLSREFILTFHSDSKQQHTGFWMHYSVYGLPSSNLRVECDLEDTFKDKQNTTTMKSSQTIYTLSDLTSSTVDWSTTPTQTNKSVLTTSAELGTSRVTLWVNHSKADNPITTTTAANLGLKKTTEDGSANRMTGILIISICVGGIVLLVVILGILLCINKRKKPGMPSNKDRSQRLQQRLNSLTFYDSIPYEQSFLGRAGLGHTSTMTTRNTNRLTDDRRNDNDTANGIGIYNTAMTHHGTDDITDKDFMNSSSYWSEVRDELNETDDDSDCIYDELERNSTVTTISAKSRPTKTSDRETDVSAQGQGHSSVRDKDRLGKSALKLGHIDHSNDIYTHV